MMGFEEISVRRLEKFDDSEIRVGLFAMFIFRRMMVEHQRLMLFIFARRGLLFLKVRTIRGGSSD